MRWQYSRVNKNTSVIVTHARWTHVSCVHAVELQILFCNIVTQGGTVIQHPLVRTCENTLVFCLPTFHKNMPVQSG